MGDPGHYRAQTYLTAQALHKILLIPLVTDNPPFFYAPNHHVVQGPRTIQTRLGIPRFLLPWVSLQPTNSSSSTTSPKVFF